ncbi:MAG: glutathione S-transferase [Gammaproteobacteria bacterium]|nr:MAG: glutathione S-transferase [Gammaproteobacteria bacterium]
MTKSINKNSNLPILYTFRRCPYAMRSRLAIELCSINIEYREILLRDKPQSMLEASPKGTVPVLAVNTEIIIDESLDIMFWCLNQNDPSQLLSSDILDSAKELIKTNDHQFKSQLDKYKYAVRFPEQSVESYRDNCEFFLINLESLLNKNKFLLSGKLGLADIAIFPFVRQFAFVDKAWFDSTKYKCLQKWLNYHLESELFKRVMLKRDVWTC